MSPVKIRGRRRGLSVLSAVVVLATVVPAGAILRASAEPATTAERILALQERLGHASAEEAEAILALEDTRERRAALESDVLALDATVLEATTELDAARRESDRLTAQYLEISRRLDETEARRRDARARFNETVATLYRTAGGAAGSYTALVLDSTEPQRLYAGSRYLAGVSGARWDVVEELRALQKEAEALAAEADRGREEVAEALAGLEAEREQLERLRAERAARRDAAAAEQLAEERQVAEVRTRVAEYEAELASLQATSSEIGSMLATAQAGQQPAAGFVLVRPVPGEITSGFGERVHPILGTVRMHAGADMHADYGTPIVAGAAGEVVWAGWRDGYGNTVIIDHGNRFATLYAHQSVVRVSVGQTVEAGQVVGEVGSTGLSTGPHLHFEVRVLGTPVDPAPYL
ncbi:MAG: peptidoglycan DD-metalloendopeptidase family protein [Acidimicrobiia bacterium]|nr:peptidoglycan DD-metalloendopeptidase family protein [Acidimicrobiia bacterium]